MSFGRSFDDEFEAATRIMASLSPCRPPGIIVEIHDDIGLRPRYSGTEPGVNLMKKLSARILHKLGYSLVRNEPPKPVVSFSGLWLESTDEGRKLIAPLLVSSKSQFAQDLFVVIQTGGKREGFFVEFGATDGVCLSNSWLLEKELGWSGILAEPARVWHQDLAKNRNCAIDRRCVTNSTGQSVEFLETGSPTEKFESSGPELSSMAAFADGGDWAARTRVGNSIRYSVETVSLNDLLEQHHAPAVIDYLSIDTEGSELLILRGFDFDRHAIKVMTVEHNGNLATRQELYELLTGRGYVRRHEDISGPDDWYVLAPSG